MSLQVLQIPLLLDLLLLGVGIYLLLPQRHGRLRPRLAYQIGGALTGIGIVWLATFWTTPVPILEKLFFYLFGVTSLGAAILMITSRNPVYSALWFALVILSSAGLFLIAGAQFLAAGTVIVYAGAIIVTFLFVLMLAQSEGEAPYDRMARRPALATLTGMLLLASFIVTLFGLPATGPPNAPPALRNYPSILAATNTDPSSPMGRVGELALSPTNRFPVVKPGEPAPSHVAGLGATLFIDHLISVEIIGVLLFSALIGAVAIATPKLPDRSRPTTAAQPSSSLAASGSTTR
jgi:NADH-quinone oxidoreductase subunit J